MENLEFSLEEVFNEVRTRMQTQGAMTQEEYNDFIDEVLEEKREEGLIDDDYNFKQAQEMLQARWEEVAENETSVDDSAEEGL